MKLWIKITLGVVVLTVIILGSCLYYFSAIQAQYTLAQLEKDELQALDLFCINLSAVEHLGSVDTSRLTSIHSAVKYAFRGQAQLLENETTFYALKTELDLYNSCPYNLNKLLVLEKQQKRAWVTQLIHNDYFFIACMRIELFQEPYIIYLAKNVTDVYNALYVFKRTAIILLTAGMITLIVFLPLMIQRFLCPLKKLSKTAQEIAAGNYALRVQFKSNDEISEVGRQFDLMADALQNKINELSTLTENKTFLLGALTHELKTPLTAIIGFADTYLHVPLSEEQRQFCIRHIYEAGCRTEQLSKKLMQMISLEEYLPNEMRQIDVNNIITAVRNNTRQSLSTCEQVLNIQNDIKQVYGDFDLLLSLLSNLIENASRASPKGTVIDFTLQQTDDKTYLCIQDHGCGIPHEKLKHVMEPFYRVDKARDRKHGGAGLGLALCKVIADAHGGTLIITSQENIGTKVLLTLPRN